MCALQAITIVNTLDVEPTEIFNKMITLHFTGGKKIKGSRNRTPIICIPKFSINIETLCASSGFDVYDAEERCMANLQELFVKNDINATKIKLLREYYEE